MPSPISVTVVIPARNEERSIGGLLTALATQRRAPDAGIVVDAGSTDGTRDVVRREAARSPFPVALIEAGPALPGRARNLGIDRVSTDVVAMLDAGVRIDEHWLERLIAPMEADPRIDVVYGNYAPALDGLFQRAAAVVWVDPKKGGDAPSIRAESVASLAIRKRIWRDDLRFPEDLRAAEDLLFKDHLRAQKLPSALAPDALISWELPTSFGAVFAKFRDYSRCAFQAGLFRRWHYAVLRMYAALLVVAAGLFALTWSPWVVCGWLLCFHPARAAMNLRRKAEFVGSPGRWLPVLLLSALIIFVIDLAMLAGGVQAMTGRRSGAAPGAM
jgi:glycosyltransferase involved in cell wall biosynthesis